MKKIILLLTVLCTGYFINAQEQAAKLDSLLSAYAKLYKFNGSAFVEMKGTVLLDKGYGYRDITGKVWNGPQTIFQLGSITKQFTSAVILKLDEEKRLNVQDKLSKYFPGYPKSDSITIEQLMLHTSGIYSYTDDGNFMQNEVSKPSSREKMMALFKDKPLTFSPGTDWSYSNSGYSLLGYIIEIVTGKPYEQVVRQYIFSPLGMTHSGFDFTHLKATEKATGYFLLNDQQSVVAPIVDSSVSYSAGAIYSTTGDLYKWHKALQDNSVLSKAQQEKAYTPVKHKYGYGWVIDSIEGKRRVGHGGGIHGFVTNIVRVPEDDICIILLSNASNEALEEMTRNIFNVLYNKPYELPKTKTAIVLPEEKLKEYVGEYEIQPNLHLVTSIKDGVLWASPTGQSTVILHAEKEDVFFVKEIDIQVRFVRNEKKEIESFILYQGGAELVCKKIK